MWEYSGDILTPSFPHQCRIVVNKLGLKIWLALIHEKYCRIHVLFCIQLDLIVVAYHLKYELLLNKGNIRATCTCSL